MSCRGFTTILCAALLALAAARLWGQDISVGGRLGLVASAAAFEDKLFNTAQQPRPGLQVGGTATLRLSTSLALQAELAYVQKGWTETDTGSGCRLAYMELPLLLVWRASPHLLAGVAVGREVGCSVTGVPAAGTVSCDDPRVEWRRARTQVGTWFGIGMRRPRGSGQIDVQLRGNIHLTDINRETLPRGSSRLLALTVSAAYVVPLGGS